MFRNYGMEKDGIGKFGRKVPQGGGGGGGTFFFWEGKGGLGGSNPRRGEERDNYCILR